MLVAKKRTPSIGELDSKALLPPSLAYYLPPPIPPSMSNAPFSFPAEAPLPPKTDFSATFARSAFRCSSKTIWPSFSRS